MAVCPTCLTKYPDTVESCATDGAALVPEQAFAYVDKDLAAGDVVGEYRVEGKLGEGGFGAVFQAVHPVIGKSAAIKVLSRQFSANPQMVSRFIAEARAVNQIRHRNIIDIFAFGQLPDGRQYYVMELLDGTPFDRYLATQKRLTLAQALPIFRGISRALEAAHGKGILHRDLKPENVYLVFDEERGVEVKLLDFGLAKLLTEASGEHKTKTGTPMGTPYYMSPEQCRGKDVDRRTDIYAFGAMIFEVLTGRVPFTGDSPMDVLLQHMTADAPRASEICADVPSAFDEPIRRMLAKEPHERPSTIAEALESLVTAATAVGAFAQPGALPSPTTPTVTPTAAGVDAAMSATEAGSGIAAPAPVKIVTGGEAVRAGGTFLGAESDVAPVRRSRARTGAVAIFALLGALVVAAVFLTASRTLETPRAGGAGAGVVQTGVSAASPTSTTSIATTTASTPAYVDVRVEGAPKGAVVLADGAELGVAPGPFKLAAGTAVKLTVSAKAHKSRDVTLTPTSDTVLHIALDRHAASAPLAPAATRGGGIPADLEGFDKK